MERDMNFIICKTPYVRETLSCRILGNIFSRIKTPSALQNDLSNSTSGGSGNWEQHLRNECMNSAINVAGITQISNSN